MTTTKPKKKNEGKIFEEDFMSSFPADIFTYRLRDSAGAWGGAGQADGGKSKIRFTVTNMCDFLAVNPLHNTLFLELKTTNQKSMPFTNLKKHQVYEMSECYRYDGCAPYFVFNFRAVNRTFAIPADKIKDFFEHGDRKSFSIDWCEQNGIEINSKIKKVRYSYDISPLLN